MLQLQVRLRRLGDLEGKFWHYVNESAKGAVVIRAVGGQVKKSRLQPSPDCAGVRVLADKR